MFKSIIGIIIAGIIFFVLSDYIHFIYYYYWADSIERFLRLPFKENIGIIWFVCVGIFFVYLARCFYKGFKKKENRDV